MKKNVVSKYCNLLKKDANFLMITYREIGNAEPIAKRVKDCLSVDEACMVTGCKYVKGAEDPFNK